MERKRRNETIAGVVAGFVIVLVGISIFFPESFRFETESKPYVRFHDFELAENKVTKGTTTNIMAVARNYDEGPVKNVEVHAQVIEGGNPERHLEFPRVTKLGDIDKKWESQIHHDTFKFLPRTFQE